MDDEAAVQKIVEFIQLYAEKDLPRDVTNDEARACAEVVWGGVTNHDPDFVIVQSLWLFMTNRLHMKFNRNICGPTVTAALQFSRTRANA